MEKVVELFSKQENGSGSVCVLCQELDRSVFFLSTVLRLSTNAGQWKEAASKVTHALVNIR